MHENRFDRRGEGLMILNRAQHESGENTCLTMLLSQAGHQTSLQLYLISVMYKICSLFTKGHTIHIYTVAEYSWSIVNNFVIGVYCRCLEILCQIAFSSIANYFRSYRKKQFGIKSIGIYSRHQ